MLRWSIRPLHLELKFLWEISRGSASHKINYIVTVEEAGLKCEGEVAGLTGVETLGGGVEEEFKNLDLTKVSQPKDCYALDVSEALRFGIESALTHLRAKQQGVLVEGFLSQPIAEDIATSFSIPLMPIEKIEGFIQDYKVREFPSCKVKIGKEHKLDHCLEVTRVYKGPIRIDANESLSTAEEVLELVKDLNGINIEFIEQPLPASSHEEYIKLKKAISIPLVADESLQANTDISLLVDQFHGINVKLMKAGGYLKAIEQLRQARKYQLKTMLGCMVETNLGINCARLISHNVDWIDLDGHLFLAKDPYFEQ